MRKFLIVAALVLGTASVSHAQLFEALSNPNLVAGASYRLEAPPADIQRVSFLLSANVAGIKVGELPLYVGGFGVDLRTIDPNFGAFGDSLSMTIPAATYFPKGDKVLVQVGYSYALSDAAESRSGVYLAVGFAWQSPNYLEYKREVKRHRKLKAAGKDAGPPPVNPYDVQ